MLNLSVGDVIFKKFRITDGPITSGNTSIVWKVHHIEWNVDMALKIPKDEYYKSNKEMFDDECLKWVNLGMHNNVAACYFILKMNSLRIYRIQLYLYSIFKKTFYINLFIDNR